MPEWYFRKMVRGEMNEDPTATDFFNVNGLTDSLIREAIQNSLDAKLTDSTEPVRVRIFISETDESLETEQFQEFSGSLWQHAEASDALQNPPSPNDKVRWLVIEDFGTRGLVGDYSASEDPPVGEKNDFYYFWRNVGRGAKTGSERGRWGLGKTMFPSTSQTHTFFGFTVTKDGESLLMGQTVLNIHWVGENKHNPYGYFGIVDPEDGFVEPITDQQFIDKFQKTFQLERNDETGLSVVIPFPREAIKFDEVLQSVIRHYFYPILAGELLVDVWCGSDVQELNKANLLEVAQDNLGAAESGFHQLLDLTSEFLVMLEHDAIYESRISPPNRSPKWNDDELFSGDKLAELTTKLDDFETVAIRVPVNIRKVRQQVAESHFYLVLKRDSDLEKALDVFVRQGITISGVTSLRDTGVLALVVAQDGPLATFLGDSENPAHTEWLAGSSKFKGKYSMGPSTLEFVKNAPLGFMRLLNRNAVTTSGTALRQYFPGDASQGQKTKMKGGASDSNPTKKTRRAKVNLKPKPKIINISRKDGGFTISLTDEGQARVPFNLIVRCAYDTARGNEFKRWSAVDFNFSDSMDFELIGGSIISAVNNKIQVLISASEFKFSISGFDIKRDVIIDTRLEY